MMSGNVVDFDEFLRTGQDPFDVFIGSISFEKRCLGAALKLRQFSKNPKYLHFIDYSYLLPIKTERNAGVINENREKRIELQKRNREDLLRSFPKCATFPSKIEDPISHTIRLVESFCADKQVQIDTAQNICLDISTLTKPLIFLFLKAIVKNFNKKNFYVVNTIPSKYTPSLLSFNIWGSEIMPTFNGEWVPSNRNALVAILGFEGHKLSSILEKWTFTEIMPLVGFPAFYPGLQDRTLLANANILKLRQPRPTISFAPASDPFETYRTITTVLDRYSKNYNIALAPLGPKPMALAAALLAIERNLRVVYTFPQEYSYSYSSELGKTLLYEIKLS